MNQRPIIPITLHPPQAQALQSNANEILYGGAAGGGKSYLMRVAALSWCLSVGGLHVYLFRRLLPDLLKTHLDGPKGFRALLAPLVQVKQVFITQEEIRFANGSKIYLCHCQDAKDVYKYLSSEIHVLLIDELTTFDSDTYRFLRSRVRCVGLNIPPEYENYFPRILCGSNPGNVGHAWVKSSWVDGHIPLEIWQTPNSEGGMTRQFIPARLDDNPSLLEDDPYYEHRLSGLGSAALVRAYRDGDWGIIAGAFFPEYSYAKHVIQPFPIPKHWTRFCSFDWGSSDPFCVLWYAISDGVDIDEDGKHKQHVIPRGTIVVYREWYGFTGEPNKGLKLPNHEIARGIVEREALEPKISYRVSGHDIWIKKGGPSIAEDMEFIDFEKKVRSKIVFHHAVIDRINGHSQVRSRLVGDERGAGVLIFNTCVNLIRTLPVLQHDPKKPEDILDHMEDHPYDSFRYGLMSRPWTSTPKERDNIKGLEQVTMDLIWKETRNKQDKYIY
jgi:hypothetical protein